MGILTHITDSFDVQNEEQIIWAVTKFEISQRATLNRIAGRAAVMTGVGQRTLVAAAYDELELDMVWRDGPFAVLDPEEKWPEAQNIEFFAVPIERRSEFLDITQIPTDAIPGGALGNELHEGIATIREESVLNVWRIPIEIGGRRS